ncbi:SprT-like domain-containing protein [Candidatus Woesearchaeota archaeon]|nr:SprT-like domain-containing protein [Candidatus Woesearchaeota archaeon]
MNIIQEAFQKIFPEKPMNYSVSIKYSGKFKPYNANVQINKFTKHLEFKLSRTWKQVSREIKIGLIQSLLVKIFKQKASTMNIDLYNSFIKNLHISIPKTDSDPILLDSFNRVNQIYFFNSIEQPNLKWGSDSATKLGSYEYQTDTITISSIFKNTEQELLDYIVYHELLHKKHKFKTAGTRSYHHTKQFKKEEKKFKNSEEIEKKLKKLCRKTKIKRTFFFNWLK